MNPWIFQLSTIKTLDDILKVAWDTILNKLCFDIRLLIKNYVFISWSLTILIIYWIYLIVLKDW